MGEDITCSEAATSADEEQPVNNQNGHENRTGLEGVAEETGHFDVAAFVRWSCTMKFGPLPMYVRVPKKTKRRLKSR